jgi:hypothetical protein
MNLDNVLVADCETDGLYENASKMHVLSLGYREKGKWKIKSTNKKEDVEKIFCNPTNVIVMHNGLRYDKPVLEKIHNIKITATIVDSLALAWYVFPNREKEGKKYGLESFGEDYGVPKPKVEDWKQQSYEIYKERCQEDTRINILLWEDIKTKLDLMYGDSPQDMVRVINILNWIMECSFMQEVQKIRVDVEKVKKNLAYLESLKEEKTRHLMHAMPKIPIKVSRNKPKIYKKDGSVSSEGEKWLNFLKERGLEESYNGVIEEITRWEQSNPNSVKQKKDWLYSLGWTPQTFKHNRNKETGEVKVVEQIMTEDKMLCPSVLKLLEKEPAIESLDGLTVLTHRIGILKSFLEKKDDRDMISQGLWSLAVTMRWKHSVIVNLPKYTGKGDIRDGKWVRECLIAGDGKSIVQSDLSGIESRTSDHYTFHINPERIKKTQMPYFDPHCEISVSSNLMTSDEEIFYVFKSAKKDDSSLDVETFSELYKPTDKVRELLSLPEEQQKDLMGKLKIARSKGKTCNYASLYNVGAETLARNLEIPVKEANKLIDAYWKIHYAVKVASDKFQIKKIGEENWVYNPISNFYYYLRNKKDIFSTVNQSSAVYCFNIWVWNCTKMGIFPVTQSHDDTVYVVDEKDVEKTKNIIKEAMRRANRQLNLNVELACETQVGKNIAETH